MCVASTVVPMPGTVDAAEYVFLFAFLMPTSVNSTR